MGQIIIAVATACLLPGLPALSYGAGRWTAGMKSRIDDVTWYRILAILSLIAGVGVFVTLYLLWKLIFFSGIIAVFVVILLIWFQIDWFERGERAHRRAFRDDLVKRQQRRSNNRAVLLADPPVYETKLFWWSMTATGVLATGLSFVYNVGIFAISSGVATLIALGLAIRLTWRRQ